MVKKLFVIRKDDHDSTIILENIKDFEKTSEYSEGWRLTKY